MRDECIMCGAEPIPGEDVCESCADELNAAREREQAQLEKEYRRSVL
jgi:predicted nucleic acid-binding Zn ribbon protein